MPEPDTVRPRGGGVALLGLAGWDGWHAQADGADDRAERATLYPNESGGASTSVIEFCLVCGTVEWLDDRYRQEAEHADVNAANMGLTLGVTYRVSYKRRDAHSWPANDSSEFTYRGLGDGGGRHRFDPAECSPAVYLLPDEVTSADPIPGNALASGSEVKSDLPLVKAALLSPGNGSGGEGDYSIVRSSDLVEADE